jgi:hypothetical protein
MAHTQPDKRSKHELKRLVEQAVTDLCALSQRGMWLCVDELEVRGHPPKSVRLWATLHFMPSGSPFCCSEPGCHLWLLDDRLESLNNAVRRSLCLEHDVKVEFVHIRSHASDGTRFTEVEKLVRAHKVI